MQHGAVEEGLTRVIGVDGVPDRRLDGLDDDALLAIHRSLVLLRTYDERSVVYHRQGRIGTYAIFWGHEAIQAGAVHALEHRDWIFPSYRESAIGLLRGLPAATILRGGEAIRPAGGARDDGERRVDLRPDRDPGPPRGRTRLGPPAERRRRGRGRPLRRRRDLRGRVPRGREHRRGHEGTARAALQQQPVGDLDAARRADGRRAARRQGGRLRDARGAGRRPRRARRPRRGARGGRARPCR